MKTVEANIEIKRRNNILSFISVIMPTWNKIDEDGLLHVHLPLLGLQTEAKDEVDVEAATMELIKCFAIASERFGQGVEKELETLGWIFDTTTSENTLLSYKTEDDAKGFLIEQMLETGDQFAKSNLTLA